MSGSSAYDNAWVRCREPRSGARAKLVCFPHAGGAASSYLRWSQDLPAEVEVHAAQYPGREDRFNEQPCSQMPELVEPLVQAVVSRLDDKARLVLFGHSLGGAICYEVAAGLHARGCPPDLVIISGRQPPSLHRPGELHRRSDEALLADLRRLNPDNAEAFDSRELMTLALPMIRADYQAIETYRPRPKPPLECPLLVMLGQEDPDLSEADARTWSTFTTVSTQVETFPGDHFYLESHRHAVLAYLGHVLAATVSSGRSPENDSI